MLNFHRAEQILSTLFPPVPPGEQWRLTAARDGLTPVAPPMTPTPATPTPAGVGQPPAVEMCVSEPIHPSLRYRLTDHSLAAWLADWTTEEQP